MKFILIVLLCLIAQISCHSTKDWKIEVEAALKEIDSSNKNGNMLFNKEVNINKSKFNLTEKIEELESFTVPIHINIKLIGFDGSGYGKIKLDENTVEKYLSKYSDYMDIPVDTSKETKSTESLLISRKYLYTVSHTDNQVCNSIKNSIEQYISKYQNNILPQDILFPLLDSIYNKSAISYSIFIINCNLPVFNNQKIAYSYSKRDFFLSTKYRYVGIDLSSGPSLYGPNNNNIRIYGSIQNTSIPRINMKNIKYYFTPKIISLIDKFTSVYFCPSLYFKQTRFSKLITLQVLIITEDVESTGKEETKWMEIYNTIKNIIPSNQHIRVFAHETNFIECELCSIAYDQSIKFNNNNNTEYNEYIDSKELHRWLALFEDTYWHITSSTEEGEEERSIPIFIFKLNSSNPILFDRQYQSVSYSDMVIGIETNYSEKYEINFYNNYTDFKNNTIEENAYYNMRNCYDLVVTNLLSTIWSIPPLYKYYNRNTNELENLFLLAYCDNPYNSLCLNNNHPIEMIQDTIETNNIVNELNYIVNDLIEGIEHFRRYNKNDIYSILTLDDYKTFLKLWKSFISKVETISSSITIHDYETGNVLIHRIRILGYGIHIFLHDYGQKIKSEYKCNTGYSTGTSMVMILLFCITISSMLMYIYIIIFNFIINRWLYLYFVEHSLKMKKYD